MDKEIKVVDILTPFRVVLNCGKNDGVKNDMLFLVYCLGKIIKDNETGEELEQLEIVRGRGRVIHIQDKICTLESIESKETPKIIEYPDTSISKALGLAFRGAFPKETVIEMIKTPFEEVQIGDKARKLSNMFIKS